MADAIIYSSMDPAGPGLRPETAAISRAIPAVTRTYEILFPCLVTGYGVGADAKPGQGWTVVHANLPTGFTLQAPDGVFYVFCNGPSTPVPGSTAGDHGCQFFMAEEVSTPYTYPPTGTNVRSGDYSSSNPGAPTRHWTCFSSAQNPEQRWFLIARGSQVLFMRDNRGWDVTGGENAGTVSNSAGVMYFLGNINLNDLSAPRSGPQSSVVQGGYINTDTSTSTQTNYGNNLGDWLPIPSGSDNPGASFGGCTRLRDLLSGVVETGALVRTTANPAKHSQVAFARNQMLLLPADLRLEPVDVWLAGVGSVGKIPGLFHGGRSCHYRTSDLLAALGKGTSMADCLVPSIIDGEPYYVLPTAYGSVLVSLLEKYWQ